MYCIQCQNLLTEYLADTLGSKTATQVRTHLTSCLTCQQEYAALAQLRTMLQNAPLPGARHDFWDHALQHLPSQAASRSEQENSHRAWDTKPSRLPRFTLRFILRQASLVTTVASILALAIHFNLFPHSQPSTKPAVTAPASQNVPITVSMDALIALHASDSATSPLSDSGRLSYLASESHQADLKPDGILDIQ